jgi:S-adenosylhomocysteine hydrolase
LDGTYYGNNNQLPLIKKILEDNIIASDFSDCYIVACQHVLPSLHLMINSFIELGISKKKIFVIGKCYSTSITTYNNMINEDIYVSDGSYKFNSHMSFDVQHKENISNLISYINFSQISQSNKIILLDDGGDLIKLINNTNCKHSNIVAIEQTSSGYNKIKNIKLNFPVINVARSYIKLLHESPFIIKSLYSRILSAINKHNINVNRCLLIGKGVLGHELYKQLSSIYPVDSYDIKSSLSTIKIEDIENNNYDLIIGATGVNSLPFNKYKNFKSKTLLISTSSSDIEFDSSKPRSLLDKYNNPHQDIIFNNCIITNSGFPINFHNMDEDNIPLSDIQLTFALIFLASCYQNNNSLSLGLHDIPLDMQNNLMDNFIELKTL